MSKKQGIYTQFIAISMGERMIDQDRPSMIWGFPFFRRTKFYHKAWSLWSKYIYLRVCCPSGEWWNYGNMDVGHEHHHHHHQYLYLYLYLRISIRIYISINHRHPHLHPHPHPIHVSSLQSSELLYQKKHPKVFKPLAVPDLPGLGLAEHNGYVVQRRRPTSPRIGD